MFALHYLLTVYLLSSKMSNFGSPEYITKIVCFGQKLKLACKDRRTLQIYGAAYEMLERTSQLCRHVRNTSFGCNRSQMIQIVRDMCDGKEKCLLGYGVRDHMQSINCHTSMYFNVSYRCASNTLLGRDAREKSRNNLHTHNVRSIRKMTEPIRATKTPVKWPNITSETSEEREDSLYFTLLGLFVDFRLAGDYIGNHSLWLILCMVSSFAVGILVLIIYALIFKLCSNSKGRRLTQHEVTSRNVESVHSITTLTNTGNIEQISPPRHPVTPLSESSASSDAAQLPLLKETKDRRNQHQVISTIRRTHSVDEQTQTNSDDNQTDSTGPTCTLSATEMRELGYLVADLKVYESKIEDSIRMCNKAGTSCGTSLSEYENLPNFFYTGGPSTSPCAENKSFSYEKYSTPFPTISANGKEKRNNIPQRDPSITPQRELRRFPSEISYTTSTSNNSDEHTVRESFLLGDNSTSRLTSMQRNYKLGVRGDGFDYIVGNT